MSFRCFLLPDAFQGPPFRCLLDASRMPFRCFTDRFSLSDASQINATFAEFRRASFPCSQKHSIFMIFGPKAPGARAHGPRPLGPMGPHFLRFLENLFYGLGPI